MQGLKVWLCAAAMGLIAGQAYAQGFYVPTQTVGFPVVAGPVYTPVPVGVRYAPAYRYVTPVTYSYSAPVVATPVATTSTTVVSPTVVAPVVAAPVTSSYVTQTSYYTPTVVTPLVPVVRPYARVSVFPRRGVVRVRY